MSVYSALSDTSKKKFVVLIDPDKPTDEQVIEIARKIAVKCNFHHHQGVSVPSAKSACI